MSSYCKEKVLRYPVHEDPYENFENKYPSLFDFSKPNMFQVAPTTANYIDYVLESNRDSDCADYGKTRALTLKEQEKYKPVWEQLIPNIDMNQVRLVEYSWYNATEAPDYYDDIGDTFYDEA